MSALCDPAGAQASGSSPRPFTLAGWRVDPIARELTDGSSARRVSPKAMQVLVQLVTAGGRVVTRDALLDAVWPDVVVGEEVLTHAIAELRAAFGDTSRNSILIETVRKAGYRLLQPSTSVPSREAAIPVDLPAGFDLEAHLLCSEAANLREQAGPGQVEQATALCAEAIGRAPSYAPALAAFAIATVFRRLCCDGAGPSLESAFTAAETAARLRPDLAAGHAALGMAFAATGRWNEAQTAFHRALEREPSDFETHFLYARTLFSAGSMVAAARLAEHGANLHATDTRVLYLAASAWTAAGDGDRARHIARTGLARSDRRLADQPHERRSSILGAHFLALLDQPDAAIERIGEAGPVANPLTIYGAMALARCGERRQALDWLEAAFDAGWRDTAIVRADPALAALRREPRYRRLEAALRLG
jgi:DNA-binding winged helix-turn-helix (wHTH) protein